MLSQYKTVYSGGEAEIIEKKSRFIATVRPVKTEEEAIAILKSCAAITASDDAFITKLITMLIDRRK